MSRTDSVTVIVPAYNAGLYLQATLESIQSQTQRPEQIIVIDDGSTDDTAAIAENMGAMLVQQDRKGPGAARNRGINLADTELIAFCDADDYYHPDKLKHAIEELASNGSDCITTDAWVVRGDQVGGRKNEHRDVPSKLTLKNLLTSNPIVCSTVVAQRQALLQAGCFDDSKDLVATEDYDLWLRMASKQPIQYVSEPLTFYRVHPASLSSNTHFLRGIEKILERIAKQHADDPEVGNLIKQRRAGVRLDIAWDDLLAGRQQEARKIIREAQDIHPTWKGLKMKLRSYLKR